MDKKKGADAGEEVEAKVPETIPETPEKKIDSGPTMTDKMRENPWVVATLVLGAVALILLISDFSGGMTGGVVGVASQEDVQQKVLDFVNSQVDAEVEVVSTKDMENGLYEVMISLDGRELPIYVTKDGKNLVQGVTPFEAIMGETEQKTQEPAQTSVPKSDKPHVELFVMSICPFGTQAEKGIIPALELLGDKVDFDLRFVSYAMHDKPEIDENTVQYCVQKEQPEKLYDYLRCYLQEKDESKWESCLGSVGINKAKIDACVEATDEKFKITELYNDKSTWSGGRFPLYNVDKELNTQYGVRGSPTLVINGVVSSAGRDSASYLNAICNSFNEVPEECGETLSSDTPSPGFGWEATASANSAAQCA